MPKILHIINDLNLGGAEKQLFFLLHLAKQKGNAQYQHGILCLQNEGVYGKTLEELGYPVFYARLGWTLPWALFKIYRHFKPQVIQTWLYHSDFLGMLIRPFLFQKAQLVWNLRCSNIDLNHYSSLTKIILEICAHRSYIPNVILANSQSGLDYHRNLGYGNSNMFVIPNGFDDKSFYRNEDWRKQIRESFGIPENSKKLKILGMFARFDPMKDFDTLLEAFAKVIAAKPNLDIRLLLAGKDVSMENPFFKAKLEALKLENKVFLLGPRMDVPELLNALDLFVLSSAFGEGCSNALAEALLCELPCIATDVGDNALLLEDKNKIVPPKNPEALANAILENLEEQKQALYRAKILEHYSLDAMLEKYENLYGSLCAE